MSNKKPVLVCVCPDSGYMLCNDNTWRRVSSYTYAGSIKIFRYLKSAQNAMRKFRCPLTDKSTESNIVYLYPGEYLNGKGEISNDEGELLRTV